MGCESIALDDVHHAAPYRDCGVAAVEHPNIVKLLNVFEAPGKVNLVMERCEGGELFNLLEVQSQLSSPSCPPPLLSLFPAVAPPHAFTDRSSSAPCTISASLLRSLRYTTQQTHCAIGEVTC